MVGLVSAPSDVPQHLDLVGSGGGETHLPRRRTVVQVGELCQGDANAEKRVRLIAH